MTAMTIKDLKVRLEAVSSLSDPFFEELKADKRLGVQKAVSSRKRALEAILKEEARLEAMLTYEQALYQKGFQAIAGIDEVGRGPLAGPVVAACVILPKGCTIKGLNDSKKIPKLSMKQFIKPFKRKRWELVLELLTTIPLTGLISMKQQN